MDCPVSGGLSGARNGTLALMVSCPAAAYDQLHELLAVFGKPIFVSEIPGAAQTMKLANNLLAACAIAISSEAFVFGVKGGLDPATMCEVFNASSGRNTATLDKFPRSVLPGTFDFGFSTALAFKDVKLCLDEAEALGVPTPVGNAVRQILGVTQAMFGPKSNFTSMVRPFEQWAGVEVRSLPQGLNGREASDREACDSRPSRVAFSSRGGFWSKRAAFADFRMAYTQLQLQRWTGTSWEQFGDVLSADRTTKFPRWNL